MRIFFGQMRSENAAASQDLHLMKKRSVLVSSSDGNVSAAVLDAAAKTQRPVRFARTAREAFRVLSEHRSDVDVVIVDLDEPMTHALAILSAVDGFGEKPPVIVLTALEQYYVEPIVRWYGCIDCLAKPISSESLVKAIEKAAAKTCTCPQCSCDRWGHPQDAENAGSQQTFTSQIQAMSIPKTMKAAANSQRRQETVCRTSSENLRRVSGQMRS